jgi:hypothetical protein
MFLCEPCACERGVVGITQSFGPCEACDDKGTVCFDIPAAWLPDESIWDEDPEGTGQTSQGTGKL